MELSLDDIIQTRFRSGKNRGRGRSQLPQFETNIRLPKSNLNENRIGEGRGRGRGRGVRGRGSWRGGVGRGFSGGTKQASYTQGIGDARFKIIQKKRQKLTDARDKLAQIAKQTDARYKLQKLRDSRVKVNLARGKFAKSSISLETEPNGQINLTTSIKKGVPPLRRSINNQDRANTSRARMPITRRINNNIDMEEDNIVSTSSVLRRTVNNDIPTRPVRPVFTQPVSRNPYSWGATESDVMAQRFIGSTTRSLLRDASGSSEETRLPAQLQQNNLKIIARNSPQLRHQTISLARELQQQMNSSGVGAGGAGLMPNSDDDWDYEHPQPVSRGVLGSASRLQVSSVAQAEVLPWRHSAAGRMSSELKARLDAPASMPRTMGILSGGPRATAAIPPTPVGHRIVVSNLQTSVTQEDIRELFEDIGPLVTSRLVRPGTAEVVYQQRKDAMRAVDVYHNRQLDGQPMKCMLVNPRPPGQVSTSAAGAQYKLPSGGKSAVVPDIGTIHKALFNSS